LIRIDIITTDNKKVRVSCHIRQDTLLFKDVVTGKVVNVDDIRTDKNTLLEKIFQKRLQLGLEDYENNVWRNSPSRTELFNLPTLYYD